MIQEGRGDAGRWKRLDNEILDLRHGAPPIARFHPVLAVETPGAVDELCLSYRCIHPFRDGNGRAYREFEERVGQVRTPRGTKTGLGEVAINTFLREFGLSDLEHACPGVSRDMVRRVSRKLQKAGKVVCLGRSPRAAWRKMGNTLERG